MSGQRKRIVGLTGGIGSGKSTATAYLRTLGAATFDADSISRALLDVGGGCYGEVIAAFGEGIVRADGTIDRSALARIVFTDEAQRERLNAIVHPAVCDALLSGARAALDSGEAGIAVLDVPLLFECGLYRKTDENILIYADDDVRVRRVTARDGLTETQVRARMAAQMPQAEKRQLADAVIDNSGTLAELYAKLDSWYESAVRARGKDE